MNIWSVSCFAISAVCTQYYNIHILSTLKLYLIDWMITILMHHILYPHVAISCEIIRNYIIYSVSMLIAEYFSYKTLQNMFMKHDLPTPGDEISSIDFVHFWNVNSVDLVLIMFSLIFNWVYKLQTTRLCPRFQHFFQ